MVARYVVLNPVRAGIVERPAPYRWSSYRCHAMGEPDPLITPPALYRAPGSQPTDQQLAYRALCENHLDPQTLDTVRCTANKGTILGHDRFHEQIEAAIQRRVTRQAHGGDRRSDAYRERRGR